MAKRQDGKAGSGGYLVPAALALGLGAAGPVPPAAVIAVPYSTLETRLATRIDFEDFPRRMSPGLSLDGVQPVDGAALGERFAGQALWQQDGFDRLTPTAVPPLRLLAGAARENLAVSFIGPLSNQLGGLAPPGWPAIEAGGEGAIAILFDRDQHALGFRVAADPRSPDADAPLMRIAFFRRDASLVAELSVPLAPGRAAYGFERAGAAADIAGIAITNDDPQGIAIDDLIFDVTLSLSDLR